jgi:hypothetical protein
MLIGSALVLAIITMVLQSLFLNPYISIVIGRVYGSIYREAAKVEPVNSEVVELEPSE